MMDEAHAVDLILCGHSHGGQWQISRGCRHSGSRPAVVVASRDDMKVLAIGSM